ncbi:MAG: TorF family putative porin [Burkholderiales bacterium]|nr:TorF family putative porin [Burkholderiales bacterium]
MHSQRNLPRCVLISLATLVGSAAAHAQFSVNAGVATSYIFRGLNQTDYKPALQVGADWSHTSGLYAGVWASNVRWLKDFGVSSGRAEIDLYAGFKNTVGAFSYDVGVLRYEYTGSTASGATNPDTTELYVAGTWDVLTVKYSHAISNTFGNPNSKNSWYLDATATIPVMDKVSLTLHAGRQKIKGPAGADATYSDGKIALGYDFGNGLTAEGGVTFTDADKSFYTPLGKKFVGKTTPYALVKYTHSF